MWLKVERSFNQHSYTGEEMGPYVLDPDWIWKSHGTGAEHSTSVLGQTVVWLIFISGWVRYNCVELRKSVPPGDLIHHVTKRFSYHIRCSLNSKQLEQESLQAKEADTSWKLRCHVLLLLLAIRSAFAGSSKQSVLSEEAATLCLLPKNFPKASES